VKRVSTGLAALNPLIEGGFPSGTVGLVSGGPGTGKTLFGLNFLVNGSSKGERCCLISFNERADGILRACGGIGTLKGAKELSKRDLLIKHITLGREVDVERFIRTVEKYPTFERLVIDDVNKLLLYAKDSKDYRYQLCELVDYLRKKVNCTLLLCETEEGKMDTGNGEAFECDGVVHLSFSEFEEKPLRTLKIEKLRYTSFEPRVAHELIINSRGLRLSKRKVI